MDFRTVDSRIPEMLFEGGEIRIYLGNPETAKERRRLERVRETLHALKRQGDWTTLRRIKDGELSAEEVHAAVRRVGLESYPLELREERHAPPLAGEVERWLETLDGLTERNYRSAMKRILSLLPDDVTVDVGRHRVREVMDELRRAGLKPNTRAAHQTAWSSFYTWWIADEESRARDEGREPILTEHPVRKVESVGSRATRHRFLTEEEYEHLLETVAPTMEAQYATLLFCGLRIGEFINLLAQNVDLPHEIRIRARDDWSPKGYERWGTGEGEIPIHRRRLLPHLEAYAENYAGERFFFVNPRTGEQWGYDAFRRQMKRDCKAAGIPYGREGQGVTPHTFRHTLASWLAQRDVQLMKIAELLREQVSTVAEHYAHLLPSDLDRTLNEVL